MIYFLIVVTVGGTSSITGPFLASLLLGIGDVAGKYYVPKFGAFVIYTIMIVVLICAAAGPVRPRAAASSARAGDVVRAVDRGRPLSRRARALAPARISPSGWRRWHRSSCCPGRHLILTEIAMLALFALSLDLILGYAGIISLGHAAFFGFGAYAAGLLAKHGIITEPVLALLVVRPVPPPCSASSPASWCCAAPT